MNGGGHRTRSAAVAVAWCTLIALCGCAGGTGDVRAYLGARAIVHAIRLPVWAEPSLPYEEVSLRGHDQIVLRGWLFLPAGAPRGLVVTLHGKDSNRWQQGVEAARRFVPRGWAVLAFDQRAHGASGGEFCTYGVKESRDVSAILDQLAISPVLLVGESLGAAVALQTAASDERVIGVVAAAPFSDLATIVREQAVRLGMGDATARDAMNEAEHIAGFRIDDASPLRAAEHIRVPVLLLHGTRDRYIAPAHSRRILARLPQTAKLVHLEGVPHPNVLRRPEAWGAIGRWFTAL